MIYRAQKLKDFTPDNPNGYTAIKRLTLVARVTFTNAMKH